MSGKIKIGGLDLISSYIGLQESLKIYYGNSLLYDGDQERLNAPTIELETSQGYTVSVLSDYRGNTPGNGYTYFKFNDDTCTISNFDGYVEPDGTMIDKNGQSQSSLTFENVTKVSFFNDTVTSSGQTIAVIDNLTEYYFTTSVQTVQISKDSSITFFGAAAGGGGANN